MSIDKETSPETRTFIQQGFYVNERVTSSMEIAGLELIANELGPVFWRYGFNVKYVLKSYQSKGVTTSSNTEGFLGLLWDFFRDELIPTLDVYLCAEKPRLAYGRSPRPGHNQGLHHYCQDSADHRLPLQPLRKVHWSIDNESQNHLFLFS